jgi:uncharacterized FlaG/YvyC family protein
LRKTKERPTSKTHVVEEESSKEDSRLKEEIDEFLDEIDNLLEDQETLVEYRQRGGQ